MTNHISDERLAALKAGLEGVTPGPWGFKSAIFEKDGEYDCAVTAHLDGKRQCIAEAFGRITQEATQNATALAAHIANCDPDTIASLIARLEAAEAECELLKDTYKVGPKWSDRDDHLTSEIAEHHPVMTGKYKAWNEAMELVVNRHSKAELVALVAYLLDKADTAKTIEGDG